MSLNYLSIYALDLDGDKDEIKEQIIFYSLNPPEPKVMRQPEITVNDLIREQQQKIEQGENIDQKVQTLNNNEEKSKLKTPTKLRAGRKQIKKKQNECEKMHEEIEALEKQRQIKEIEKDLIRNTSKSKAELRNEYSDKIKNSMSNLKRNKTPSKTASKNIKTIPIFKKNYSTNNIKKEEKKDQGPNEEERYSLELGKHLNNIFDIKEEIRILKEEIYKVEEEKRQIKNSYNKKFEKLEKERDMYLKEINDIDAFLQNGNH